MCMSRCHTGQCHVLWPRARFHGLPCTVRVVSDGSERGAFPHNEEDGRVICQTLGLPWLHAAV